MEKILIPHEGFDTPQQLTLFNQGIDADPRTKLKVVESNFYNGWDRLEGFHEQIDKTPRRMNGNPDYLHVSIVGGNLPFTSYLKKDEKMFLFNTSKSNVLGLQKRLVKFFPDTFIPKKSKVNFPYLLKMLQNATVVSSWFNGINGKVNAVGLFGERVDLDSAFEHYKNIGELSAITLELESEHSSKPFEVMITKFFGVILYTNWELKKDLDFLLELKTLLFHEEALNKNTD